MNAIIVSPPPIVNAPTLRKYRPRSSRLFGFGVHPAPAETDAGVDIHQAAESTTRKTTAAVVRARPTSFPRSNRKSPAAPARTRIATIPRRVVAEAAAAVMPMIASGTVLAAVLPRR